MYISTKKKMNFILLIATIMLLIDIDIPYPRTINTGQNFVLKYKKYIK